MKEMKKFKKKMWKKGDFEVEVVGNMESEGVEKVIVQVKVRDSNGREETRFATVRLDEFLRVFDEEKLEKT